MTAFAAMSMKPKKGEKYPKKKKSEVTCYSCQGKNHYAWQCKNKKKSKSEEKQNCAFISMTGSQHTSFSNMADKNIKPIMAFDTSDIWRTDSGASRHIIHRRDWFVKFTPSVGEQAVLGDDGACQVLDSGSVSIVKYANKSWYHSVIEDVLYVPKLKKNLFSVGVITSKEFEVKFSGQNVVFSRHVQSVAQGIKQPNDICRMLFHTLKTDVKVEANVSMENLETGHVRLRHVNKVALRDMIKRDTVSGVKCSDLDDFFCEACQLEKAHRLSFKKMTDDLFLFRRESSLRV